jgi:hypothetical protein
MCLSSKKSFYRQKRIAKLINEKIKNYSYIRRLIRRTKFNDCNNKINDVVIN